MYTYAYWQVIEAINEIINIMKIQKDKLPELEASYEDYWIMLLEKINDSLSTRLKVLDKEDDSFQRAFQMWFDSGVRSTEYNLK